jgi:APA family basic amino acid/polyamine antiporter
LSARNASVIVGGVNEGDPSTARLSAWDAGALVVASMIGTGVFTTSGLIMGSLGSRTAVLLVWVAGGVLALMGAAVYAELGTMMPRVGGEYVYLTHAFSPALGFVTGWLALLAGFAAPIAAGSAAFGHYAEAALPGLSARGAGLGLVVLVTVLHARDVSGAARLQLGITVMNLAALLVLIGAGAVALWRHGITASGSAPLHAHVGPGPVAVALVLVAYSYFGWNAAGYMAAEVRSPQRALPRALWIGCALVTALYVAVNAVFVFAQPSAALAGKIEVAHVTALALFGPGAARVLSALVALIMAASVSALAMTGPRIYLAMAEDGRFLRAFARRNRAGAPTAGVLLQGAIALGLYLGAAFDALLVYVGFTLSLSSGAAVAAAWWLRHTEPDRPRPYRTPAWPLPPLIYIAASLWMTIYSVSERPRESLAGGATIAAGLLLYRLWPGRARAGRT